MLLDFFRHLKENGHIGLNLCMIFQNGEISEMGQNEVKGCFILLKLRILKKEVRKKCGKYSRNEQEV